MDFRAGGRPCQAEIEPVRSLHREPRASARPGKNLRSPPGPPANSGASRPRFPRARPARDWQKRRCDSRCEPGPRETGPDSAVSKKPHKNPCSVACRATRYASDTGRKRSTSAGACPAGTISKRQVSASLSWVRAKQPVARAGERKIGQPHAGFFTQLDRPQIPCRGRAADSPGRRRKKRSSRRSARPDREIARPSRSARLAGPTGSPSAIHNRWCTRYITSAVRASLNKNHLSPARATRRPRAARRRRRSAERQAISSALAGRGLGKTARSRWASDSTTTAKATAMPARNDRGASALQREFPPQLIGVFDVLETRRRSANRWR